MTLLFIRIFFLIITALIGFYVGAMTAGGALGAVIGLATGAALILLEASLKRVSVRGLSSMVFGLLLGVFMAKLVADILSLLPLGEFVQSVSRVGLTLMFSYLGAVMALRGKDEFHLIIPYVRFKRQDMEDRIVLLDTSVIIDGRIKELYKTNFFNGRIVVPRFVLQELQRVADSDDPQKRRRGRRGLEILRAMQNDTAFDLRVHEEDIPQEDDVDSKLVRLAKVLDAPVCTTDYNLNRTAAIQGVEILNINELAGALKPVIFPEDEMDVRLLREGKEAEQAVAYTDEGVMVVVSDGRRLIGQTVRVRVTSVLQTQSGRMVFAKLV